MTEVPNELVLTRLIDAPREKLFRCWTEPSRRLSWLRKLRHGPSPMAWRKKASLLRSISVRAAESSR
jgi:hypothetical protein